VKADLALDGAITNALGSIQIMNKLLQYPQHKRRGQPPDTSLMFSGFLPRPHLITVHLEEIHRLGGVISSHVMKRRRSNIVCLAFSHETVILKNILLLRIITLGLGFENLLCFRPDAE
jgi:hypothetical protein